jgi:hypothetical protein
MATDTNVLLSLHGRVIGLNKNKDLLIDGRVAVSAPDNPAGQVVWFADFLGDALPGEVNYQEGSNGAATFAINVQAGGVARLTTAGSTDSMAVSGAQVDGGALNWEADNGGLVYETRVKIDAITAVVLFIGFTDQTAALEMPWTLSGTTFTSNQSDGFGFLFDTAATTDTIRCVGVDTDVDVTAVDTGNAWLAATWMKFRLECDVNGQVKFYIDGSLVATIAACVTPTVALVPYIGGFDHGGAARNVDIDYMYAAMNR